MRRHPARRQAAATASCSAPCTPENPIGSCMVSSRVPAPRTTPTVDKDKADRTIRMNKVRENYVRPLDRFEDTAAST